VQPLAHVRAAPFAHLDTDREVMLIWFRHDSPAAIQPLSAPPKPQPASTTSTPTPTAGAKAASKKSAAKPLVPAAAKKPGQSPT
jgi:hypothetical protein